MLFSNELVLFPKEIIKPCLGIGRSPSQELFKIITYQLTTQICPHLIDNACSIYEQRPLACRLYPIKAKYDRTDYSFSFAPECGFVIELGKRYPTVDKFNFESTIEMEVGKEVITKVTDFYVLKDRKAKRWIYNLKSTKWDRYLKP